MTQTSTLRQTQKRSSGLSWLVFPFMVIVMAIVSCWYMGAFPTQTQLFMDRQLRNIVGPSFYLDTRIKTLLPYEMGIADAEKDNISIFRNEVDADSARGERISLVGMMPAGSRWSDEQMSKLYWKGYAKTIVGRLGYGFRGTAWSPYNETAEVSVFIHW